MRETRIYPERWYDGALGIGLRMAASGLLPAAWFRAAIPAVAARKAVEDAPTLEIVTHCWQYAHTLAYQLSSLVNYPPTRLKVVMTVFYAESDTATQRLLDFIQSHHVPTVEWNWQPLPEGQLFRRGIGRNRAALSTRADWIWMTDCDIVFHEGCLDSLANKLRGCRAILVYPREERTTVMLDASAPLLQNGQRVQLVDIEKADFQLHTRDRAKGAYQIIHGDVARAIGYCDGLSLYQTPAQHWCKCYEDRAFRWLVGTQGEPLDVANVYQIRHVEKGRYKRGSHWSRIRSWIRRIQE